MLAEPGSRLFEAPGHYVRLDRDAWNENRSPGAIALWQRNKEIAGGEMLVGVNPGHHVDRRCRYPPPL